MSRSSHVVILSPLFVLLSMLNWRSMNDTHANNEALSIQNYDLSFENAEFLAWFKVSILFIEFIILRAFLKFTLVAFIIELCHDYFENSHVFLKNKFQFSSFILKYFVFHCDFIWFFLGKHPCSIIMSITTNRKHIIAMS